MYKNTHKKLSIVYMSTIILLVVLFACMGVTYAYFNAEKTAVGSIRIAKMDLGWYNYIDELTDGDVYTFASTMLVRGDQQGANMLRKDGSSSGGVLRLQSSVNSIDQYVRIKITANIGKNLFDISRIADSISTNVYLNENGGVVVNTIPGSSGVAPYPVHTLSDFAPSLQVGDVVTLSATSTGSEKRIWLQTSAFFWNFGTSRTITQDDLDSRVFFYASGTSTSAVVTNIQMEKGTVATDYEPYIAETDVSSYLTYRFIENASTTHVVGSNSFWKSGSDGYYYYIDPETDNVFNGGMFVAVCNNIVLSGSYPTEYLGRSIKISTKFETIQAQNGPDMNTRWTGAPAGYFA